MRIDMSYRGKKNVVTGEKDEKKMEISMYREREREKRNEVQMYNLRSVANV